MQITKKYPGVWCVENMRIEKHKTDELIISEYQWLDFVKKRKNIFNNKTIYRVYDCGNFLVVKEFNYFKGNKDVWLWVYDKQNKVYYVLWNIDNKKSIWFYLDLIKNLN